MKEEMKTDKIRKNGEDKILIGYNYLLLFSINFFNILDTIYTSLIVNKLGTDQELNPIMFEVIKGLGLPTFIFIKILMVALGSGILYYFSMNSKTELLRRIYLISFCLITIIIMLVGTLNFIGWFML